MRMLVLDSGVGGLSVNSGLQGYNFEILDYCADTAYFPYGTKQPDLLSLHLEKTIQHFIDDFQYNAVTLACNTATLNAVRSLRKQYQKVRFFGLEPAIKPALKLPDHGKIAIVATSNTIRTLAENKDIQKMDTVNIPADDWVPLIEAGNLAKLPASATYQKLATINPVVIVLGCTHYVFIKNVLQEKFPNSTILDGNAGLIAHIANTLQIPTGTPSTTNFYCTDSSARQISVVASKLLSRPVSFTPWTQQDLSPQQ